MSAILSPEIAKQYFDDNGAPLVGGKLHVYEAGTTTPAPSYTTEGATTENTNPIILDSRGELDGLFLKPGAYKFLLRDSTDTEIWTKDGITIRDVGSEIDAIKESVTDINQSISTDTDSHRIVSGKKSANSSQAKFLVPIGTSNQVKVLATETNLKYIVEDQEYNITEDFVASGLVTPETTNNTALVNDSTLSGQNYTKTLGEFSSVIPYDTAQSNIVAADGEFHAFKINSEILLARVDNGSSCLHSAVRGLFVNQANDPIERSGISNNDTITLCKLTWLFLRTNGSILVTDKEPIKSATEPSGVTDGQMWFNTIDNKWERWDSTVFTDAECCFVGISVQDENGNTVAARAAEFYGDFKNENTIGLEYKDSATVRSSSRYNSVNVYGTKIEYPEITLEWSSSTQMESGEVKAASSKEYNYIKENGDLVVSPHAPINRRGDLKGWYHPSETWLYIGTQETDGSSNYIKNSVESSPECIYLDGKKKVVVKSSSFSVQPENEVILVDCTSGNVDLSLFPALLAPGKEITIKKTDTSKNYITITPLGSSKIDGKEYEKITYYFNNATLISDGENFHILNAPPVKGVLIFKDSVASGTNGGSLTAGDWRTRKYGTLSSDLSFSSLSVDKEELTLEPGLYRIFARMPGVYVNNHKTRLYNETDGARVEPGSNSYYAGNIVTTDSWLDIEFEVTGTSNKVFKIQHRSQATFSSQGMGVATGFGEDEIYTSGRVEKLR
jgi:hypothetical protein